MFRGLQFISSRFLWADNTQEQPPQQPANILSTWTSEVCTLFIDSEVISAAQLASLLALSQQPRPRRSSQLLLARRSTYCGVHLQERPVSSFWCPSWCRLCWDWTWLPRPLALYSHESILYGDSYDYGFMEQPKSFLSTSQHRVSVPQVYCWQPNAKSVWSSYGNGGLPAVLTAQSSRTPVHARNWSI